MKRILKISMDVHSTNYTLCAMEPTIGAEDRIYGEIQVAPDYKEVLRFIDSLKMKLGLDNECLPSRGSGSKQTDVTLI